MSDLGPQRQRGFNEAAHKVELEARPDATDEDGQPTARPTPRRSFNMAAHKLDYPGRATHDERPR